MDEEYYKHEFILIQDLKTDKILAEIQTDIRYELNKYGIIEINSTELDTSLSLNDENNIDVLTDYTLKVYIDRYYDLNTNGGCFPDIEGAQYRFETHLLVDAKDITYFDKHIASIQSEDLCWSPYDVIGYYKSPFENRVLFVLSSRIDSEGFDDSIRFEFVGCNLNKSSFKKWKRR